MNLTEIQAERKPKFDHFVPRPEKQSHTAIAASCKPALWGAVGLSPAYRAQVAITFSSIAMGVGRQLTSSVVRVGWLDLKYSA